MCRLHIFSRKAVARLDAVLGASKVWFVASAGATSVKEDVSVYTSFEPNLEKGGGTARAIMMATIARSSGSLDYEIKAATLHIIHHERRPISLPVSSDAFAQRLDCLCR